MAFLSLESILPRSDTRFAHVEDLQVYVRFVHPDNRWLGSPEFCAQLLPVLVNTRERKYKLWMQLQAPVAPGTRPLQSSSSSASS